MKHNNHRLGHRLNLRSHPELQDQVMGQHFVAAGNIGYLQFDQEEA